MSGCLADRLTGRFQATRHDILGVHTDDAAYTGMNWFRLVLFTIQLGTDTDVDTAIEDSRSRVIPERVGPRLIRTTSVNWLRLLRGIYAGAILE
jgi:hypothetical protein